jgi:hypothetical protein
VIEPVRIPGAEIPSAEKQPACERDRLNTGHKHKATIRILASHRGHIVQPSERDPIVNQQKENLECLESQQNFV